jgi:hypothetical protein
LTGSLDSLKPGNKVGDWTVLETPRVMKSRIRCECICGSVVAIIADNLLRGRSTRCRSCVARANRPPKYGAPIRGSEYERLYRIWAKMKDRCRSPDRQNAHLYCLRGITVCAVWLNDFAAFRDWSLANGYCDDLSIDRIDNDGNYEPGNCRWATATQQGRNKRTNHLLTAFGETKPLIEWTEDARCPVGRDALRFRLDRGWSVEASIRTPTDAAKQLCGHKTKGSSNGNSTLTEEGVQAIRLLCAQGVSQVSVARQFGISQPTVSAIHLRKLWAWLP